MRLFFWNQFRDPEKVACGLSRHEQPWIVCGDWARIYVGSRGFGGGRGGGGGEKGGQWEL